MRQSSFSLVEQTWRSLRSAGERLYSGTLLRVKAEQTLLRQSDSRERVKSDTPLGVSLLAVRRAKSQAAALFPLRGVCCIPAALELTIVCL